jgi:putative transcriptional regulator
VSVAPAQPRYFAGKLLLAMPDMPDARFAHAVIALCVHDEDGAMGIDLGSAIPGLKLRALLDSFDIDGGAVPDMPVLRGGPVEPRRGFVLHSLDWGGQEMLHVGAHWGLSASVDILRAIGAGRGPSRYLVALGYAGWAAGQLDGELARPGWFLADADPALLYATPAEQRWARSFAHNGIDPALLAGQSGRA